MTGISASQISSGDMSAVTPAASMAAFRMYMPSYASAANWLGSSPNRSSYAAVKAWLASSSE